MLLLCVDSGVRTPIASIEKVKGIVVSVFYCVVCGVCVFVTRCI